ncbi:HET-domain-containing protein [Periconia macrospinosa]|uniref:HET-domain-containing protein n=1 Tax=Periconia macrospinosa TaxID=97972 RepID=A0A2V1DYL3_9PLEO|nr:HET-domain-containing protein [Periconia macrospinosa]
MQEIHGSSTHPIQDESTESSRHCPLCRQLLRWIDKTYLNESTLNEKGGDRIKIRLMGVTENVSSDAQVFRGILHWSLSLQTFTKLRSFRKYPNEKGSRSIKFEHKAPASVQFVVAHDNGSKSVISRPIWASSDYLPFEKRIAAVHDWFEQCKNEHQACEAQIVLPHNRILPARILNISQCRDTEDVVLVDPSTAEGSLNYLALSHCWGKDGVPIRTTTDNLIEHEKGLGIPLLPRTFQDAVRIGRALGYNYLGIDSLCIIQDDKDDWEREAAKMASIFRYADIVLCAASASNSAEGCDIDKDLEPALNFLFPSDSTEENNASAQMHDTTRTRLFIRRDGGTCSSLTSCPIMRRGWIFQEIFLAPRVLYFTNGHMIWQCHRLLQSEDSHFSQEQTSNVSRYGQGGILSSAPLYELKRQYQVGMHMHAWWAILGDFFQREFTKLEDTLPSLAGLINVWQEYTCDQPMVGLWKSNLPFHMCWYVCSGVSGIDRVPQQPSWCWTSIPQEFRGMIRHASADITSSEEIVWQAEIEAVDIEWERRPYVSSLQHAKISLYRGRATRGAFTRTILYNFEHEKGVRYQIPDGLERIPLVIAKHSRQNNSRKAQFRMYTLLGKRINPGQYRRKGYEVFVSSSDYTDANIKRGIKEIIDGIKVIDLISIV